MKLGLKISVLLPLTAAALLVGCGKSEQAPQTPAAPASAAPAAVKPAAAEAQKAVTATAAAASSEATGLIDKAKALIADKNYQDAANVLKELSSLKLTPEQQKLVDDLQAQLTKLMAGQAVDKAGADATKAVGDMLGK